MTMLSPGWGRLQVAVYANVDLGKARLVLPWAGESGAEGQVSTGPATYNWVAVWNVNHRSSPSLLSPP